MRAPDFWWGEKPPLKSLLLLPISLIYGGVAGWRMKRRGETAALPVICIGNFTVGGAGKTPTAIAIAELLAASGEFPAFFSRGTEDRARPASGRTTPHRARDRRRAVAPCSDRARHRLATSARPGARLALENGATAIVMDDGLQNPSLAKDCAIAVVDGATGTGNGLVFPSGPLRAPLSAQSGRSRRGDRDRRRNCGRKGCARGGTPWQENLRGPPRPRWRERRGTAGKPHSRLRRHRQTGEIFRDIAGFQSRRGGNPELSGPSRLFGGGCRVAAADRGRAQSRSRDDRKGSRAAGGARVAISMVGAAGPAGQTPARGQRWLAQSSAPPHRRAKDARRVSVTRRTFR